MSIVTQFKNYKIAANNTLEKPFLTPKGAVFNKIWIYPGVFTGGASVLTPNVGNVTIGEVGDGPPIALDILTPTDLPLAIELPAGQSKLLEELYVYGTQNDGILVKYWAPWEPPVTQYQTQILQALGGLNTSLSSLRSAIPPSRS